MYTHPKKIFENYADVLVNPRTKPKTVSAGLRKTLSEKYFTSLR